MSRLGHLWEDSGYKPGLPWQARMYNFPDIGTLSIFALDKILELKFPHL